MNFMAIAIFTRLLTPTAFGNYAVVMASIFLANSLLYQWLRSSLVRFYEGHENPGQLLSTIAVIHLLTSVTIGGLGLGAILFMPHSQLRALVIFSVLLVWLSSWFDLNLDLMRARLSPVNYGFASLSKAILAVLFGGGLAYFGLGAWGLLIGVAVANALPSMFYFRPNWGSVRLRLGRPALFRPMLEYGLPLSASFAFSYILRVSDRLMIGWLADSAAVGLYSASYDIAQNSLEILMTTINAAAFPLAVRALASGGVGAARRQLEENLPLLLAVTLPASAGLALVAPNVASVFLGGSFQEGASQLIPWVALGVALSGLRAYYFDQAFQLGKRTIGQVYVLGAAAVLNVVMNLLWIPRYGFMGAAYTTAITYFIALLLAAIMGRKSFPLPLPARELLKVIAASAIMAVLVWQLAPMRGITALVTQVLVGFVTYLAALVILDGLHIRTRLRSRVWNRTAT